jgi:hypothetical protein
MVFGFARFLEGEAIIVAINFAHNDADFYIDCSPLAKIFIDDQVVFYMFLCASALLNTLSRSTVCLI